MLGTTAAVFAHEIANPLHGLSMCIEVVKKLLTGSAVTNPQALQAIAAASLEIERLTVLLKDYRTLSRPQSSNFELTDLRKLTADVLAPQLNAYKQLGVVFDTQFEADLPSITLEPVRMKQAILNLCQNAVEAMPDGGTLTLRSYVSEKQMIIEVSDSGIGIPDGLDVFQPFKTTKRDGTGLGLPIVRQIVTDHKGTVDYVSEIGKGTAFRIMLPINNGLLR
jgi:signal transduction histidine kinase